MKIYQIHERGGEWEDKYDYINSSYLSRKKAEIKMAKLEENELKGKRCDNCPVYHWDEKCGDDFDKRIAEAKIRCDDADIEIDKEYDDELCCSNYYSSWDDSYFRIEEVEVIE